MIDISTKHKVNGLLNVIVRSCSNLPKTERSSRSVDPYIKLNFQGKLKF